MYEFKRDGEKFGALTVIKKSHDSRETTWWICKCKCGQHRTVEEQRLIKGFIRTCIKCEVKNKEAALEKF